MAYQHADEIDKDWKYHYCDGKSTSPLDSTPSFALGRNVSPPLALTQEGRFCLWRYEQRNGRKTKVPYQINGRRASSTKPEHFSDYGKAVNLVENYDGIGLGIFGNICAIDIDHCIEDDKLSPMAEDIIETMKSYTEVSPSGSGIRIIFKVEDFTYDKNKYYINNQKAGLEVYVAGSTNKFVTLTSNHLKYYQISTCNKELVNVLEKYMRRPSEGKLREITDVPGSSLSDEEVLYKALNASNSEKFSKLWNGDYNRDSTGSSQQEYDLALCSMLAFWCGGDVEQIDRLFRESGLYREKWERDDYRASTLTKAVTGCSNFYRPTAPYSSDRSDELLPKLMELDPAGSGRYKSNDLGFGRLFGDMFKDTARYVPERKKWYIYDGRRWVPDVGSLKAMEFCKDLADALVQYTATIEDMGLKSHWLGICKKWTQRRFRETYLKEAQSIYPIPMDAFDSDKYLFNCENGTLNLQTMEFYSHKASDKLTKLAPVHYDEYARNTRWSDFISQVMSSDTEKAKFLQKSLGYGISGDTRHECMFFLYRETTRNGKGTLMESVMRVIGDYGRATRPETIAQKNHTNSQGPSEDIARLAGIRMANISEPSRGLLLNTAQVKSMTGNDTINARFLNENSFDFRPQFKLYVNTNYLPVINDMTLFSSGRIMIIPFDRHFEEWEQDKSLKEEFAKPECMSAILNWLVAGFQMLQEEGFTQPDAVKVAINEYAYESNKVAQFIDECMEKHLDYKIKTADVYSAYSIWCSRNGCYVENSRNFVHELRKIGKVSRARPTSGGNKTTVLEGYSFVTDFLE